LRASFVAGQKLIQVGWAVGKTADFFKQVHPESKWVCAKTELPQNATIKTACALLK